MKKILHNSKKLNSQNMPWNIAVLGSIFFLVYLPYKESVATSGMPGGYLELLKLLPAGIYYTLLVTLLGSFTAILFGLLVGLG